MTTKQTIGVILLVIGFFFGPTIFLYRHAASNGYNPYKMLAEFWGIVIGLFGFLALIVWLITPEEK